MFKVRGTCVDKTYWFFTHPKSVNNYMQDWFAKGKKGTGRKHPEVSGA
jgi:hypothetical protein